MAIGLAYLIIGISVTITILVLRKRKARAGTSLVIFSIALTVWACAYGVLLFDGQSGGLVWLALIHLSATVTATALLAFILTYTNHEEWLGKWGILLLCLEPLVTQILFWTNRWQGLFSTEYRITSTGVAVTSSPWYWINASYSDGLMILALILLTQTFFNKPKQYLLQSIMVVMGVFIPILTKIFSMAIYTLILNLEPPLVSYAVMGCLLVFSIYRFKLLETAPLSRDLAIERMNDGWMVLDVNNRIVDLNPAAENLLGVTREQIFGQSAEEFLQNWLNLDHESSGRTQELKGSVTINGEKHYLGVRILPLVRPADRQVGKVVLWRDITDYRKADNARQRARDEMFILLHYISDTAFRTLSQNDFLMESLSQITYSFRSQAGLIFLLEDARPKNGLPKVYVAAHHGIPRSALDHLAASPKVAGIIMDIIQKQEPFYVQDVSTDARLPSGMQRSGNKSMLLVPLTTGEQVLGVIGLIQKEGPASLGNGESTRLTIVAEELAAFIRNDRKRQKAIAMEERQSLVRDLHDSISQKLYGVVTLTEAAQAKLEMGSSIQAEDVARIGERARQTLKEMRLFMFQMKPMDLEHKGLVAALNERLAAVEGRANIKARVLADEDINISLEKETILYNIALEALNNIIKHSEAKTVTILLKKRKATVSLEVVDDGCGFDPETTNGGMGLKIMQERAALVDGKVSIRSAVGKGTKVTATVSETNIPQTTRKKKEP
jgi:PAS domain S-box-containing protein